MFDMLKNWWINKRLDAMSKELKALRTELHQFETDILDKFIESSEKISKRMGMRLKRQEQQTTPSKESDPFDEVRKLNKELHPLKPL